MISGRVVDATSPEMGSDCGVQLEIVAHCIHYSRVLSYQLSSLVLHPPVAPVHLTYTLCYSPADESTQRVVRFFDSSSMERIHWNWMPMRTEDVNGRAIGRNRAARASRAEWIWFIDADFCLGPGCLSSWASLAAGQNAPLLFPELILGTTRARGEELIDAAAEPAVRGIPSDCFYVRQPFRRATGGVQITRGSVARERGYLPRSRRYQRPSECWRITHEDVAFRKQLGTAGVPISIPGVFRIRHSHGDPQKNPR